MDSRFNTHDEIEQIRDALEQNVKKFREGLHYWQTWEAEYEGLKEELENGGPNISSKSMLDLGASLEGEVVNEQEMKELTGVSKGVSRTPAQVIRSINGRIDTGRKNAQTAQKQFDAAEEQLRDAIQESKMSAPTGLPIMDIFEQLDEDGNVISSQVTNNTSTAEQLEAISIKKFRSSASSVIANNVEPNASNESSSSIASIPIANDYQCFTQSSQQADPRSKKVTFATEAEIFESSHLLPNDQEQAPVVRAGDDICSTIPVHPTHRLLELDSYDQIVGSRPLELIAPLSEEENSLHTREALRNMTDIGPIVASMNMLGAGEDDSDTEGVDDESAEDSLDENEIGMTNIGAHITDEYRSEMEALMRKHEAAFRAEAPSLDKLSIRPSTLEPKMINHTSRINSSEVSPQAGGIKGAEAQPAKKKGVRFADGLDVVTVVAPSPSSPVTFKPVDPVSGVPFSDAVIERTSHQTDQLAKSPATKKISRFKAALHPPSASNSQNSEAVKPSTDNRALGDVVPPIIVGDRLEDRAQVNRVSRFRA